MFHKDKILRNKLDIFYIYIKSKNKVKFNNFTPSFSFKVVIYSSEYIYNLKFYVKVFTGSYLILNNNKDFSLLYWFHKSKTYDYSKEIFF